MTTGKYSGSNVYIHVQGWGSAHFCACPVETISCMRSLPTTPIIVNRKMSGGTDEDMEMEDFFASLRNNQSYLAPTFYTAIGIVATLVIIIVIMMIGYCYLARYLVMRNRLMDRYIELTTTPLA